MTIWKTGIAFSAAVLLAACGGGGNDSKDLFSIWTRDGDNATFDFTAMHFGTDNYLSIFTQDGTKCICNFAVIGTQEQGSFAATGCISIPYNARRQPSCEAVNRSGNYTKTDSVLTMYVAGSSATLR